ncbi:uncharacterized protein N7483_007353 [Penicillium malachiteum]|uniref:uncharacterized protein n=1 Tax=Penicillium malachiteum TaxID=1324776 RepID=UPI002546B253|nr:uncharacterized protein N7483_007353 [Penicillium malachiteum]KAJ5725996.1 hypothetical protein N7483_007353 [Penicillium malachiteum]
MKHKLPVSKLDLLDPTKATKARALDLKTQIAEQYGETYGGLGNFKDWHILDIFAFCNAFKPAEHWDTTKANFLKTYPWKDFNSSANVKLFLYLTMLKEFWGLISSVDERWGPQSLIQPLFIWTRHCDNEDLDGRAQLVRDWAQVFGAQNPTYATIQPNGTFEYKSLMCEGMYENKKGRTKKGQKVDKVSPQQSGEVLRKEPLKKWPKVRAKACMEPDRTTDQNMKTQSRNQVLTRAMTKKAAEKMNIAGEKMNIEEETWGEIVSRKAEFIDSPYKDDSDYEFEEDEDDEDDDDKKDFWVAKPEEREILKKRGGETGLFDGKLLKLTKKMDSTTLEGNSDDNLYDIDMESDSDHDSISGFEPTRARKKFQD